MDVQPRRLTGAIPVTHLPTRSGLRHTTEWEALQDGKPVSVLRLWKTVNPLSLGAPLTTGFSPG